MSALLERLRPGAKRLVAVAVAVVLYAMAGLPATGDEERAALAARFRFERTPLPTLAGTPRTVREVHPDFRHIASWISSVGAAVALADLDGDGLANDVCHVDTRIDQVVVAPVPGTPERYASFGLRPAPLPYEPATMAPMGCLPGDFNEDGLVDLLVYYWGRSPVVFLRRGPARPGAPALAAGDYTPVEVVAGTPGWHTNAATLADVDGDGHLDLIIGNYFPDGARVLDAGATNAAQMQDSMSRADNGGGLRILRWAAASPAPAPSVRFEDVRGLVDAQVAGGWVLAVAAADLDGDLLPEIYVANDFGSDHLLHNRSRPGAPALARLQGRRTLTSPNSKIVGRDSFKGMGVDFGDVNGDGRLDIYVSNIAAEYALEESHFVFVSTGEAGAMRRGVAPYVDQSETLGLSRSGWAWEARLADFDNDGTPEAMQAVGFVKGLVNRWPELHELAMGNDGLLRRPRSWPRFQPGDDLSGHHPSPFFVRGPRGRYVDVAARIGLADRGISRGIALADVDGDGRLDFAVANQWEPSFIYRNLSPHPGAFLGLHLLLPTTAAPGGVRVRAGHPAADLHGSPAVGASVRVTRPDGRRLVAQVDGGNGHSGKRSPEVHLGLGAIAAGERVQVEVRWRDRSGHPHETTLRLTPGWHTALLGAPEDTR